MDPSMLHFGHTVGAVSDADYLRDILTRLIYATDPTGRLTAVELGLALNQQLPGCTGRDVPIELARFIAHADPHRRLSREELASAIVERFDLGEKEG